MVVTTRWSKQAVKTVRHITIWYVKPKMHNKAQLSSVLLEMF